MSDTRATSVLSGKLCPWLLPALRQLESIHDTQRLGHAWLIAGTEGVGRINLALVFADRLLRGAATEPPGLEPAEAVAAMRERHQPADHHPDLHWLFPEEEKRTISVEQVRDAAAALTLRSFGGGAKVVVIEPADAMTAAAANALLKTLEEPSDDTYLLLLCSQPERLPATIRSRCQRLNLARPAPEAIAKWLGSSVADLAVPCFFNGGAPLRVAAFLSEDKPLENNVLSDQLILVSQDKADPQAVAEGWAKLDTELVLVWLTRKLHGVVRRRFVLNGSTAVTDPGADTLHNALGELTLRTLFEQYERSEKLLNQLGTGINVGLALHALLLGFQPSRGRP